MTKPATPTPKAFNAPSGASTAQAGSASRAYRIQSHTRHKSAQIVAGYIRTRVMGCLSYDRSRFAARLVEHYATGRGIVTSSFNQLVALLVNESLARMVVLLRSRQLDPTTVARSGNVSSH